MRTLLLAVSLAGCQLPEGGKLGGGGTPSDGTGPGSTTDTADDTGGETGESGETGDDTGAVEGTGYQIGDVAYDLTGTDQEGSAWSLYGAAGARVVLVVGHMDYATMVAAMDTLREAKEAFPSALFVALAGRDEYSTNPDQDDAERWAGTYGLDVVLWDPTLINVNLWSDNTTPKTYVIGEDLVITWVSYGVLSSDELAAALAD